MDTYEKKYKKALERARKWYNETEPDSYTCIVESIFPELAESEDERIRKALLGLFKIENFNGYVTLNGIDVDDVITWLEKQGKQASAIRWYDTSLTPEEMRELLVEWDSEDATWHEVAFYHADTKTFWDGERQVENVTRWCYIDDMLEKQGQQPKKTSIWKHWKDGIAGNGDGEQIYLIKIGTTYSISSCLGCECDYIELSELDNLLLEKQVQSTTITIPKDLKGTDTDGGVVGEKGEQGEKQSKLVDFDYNANDSDLQEVTYFIPNGFHAEIDGDKVVIKQGEQKPAKWSEEDELIALSIEHVMNCASLLNIVPDKIDKIRAWLKSLKDRYTWKPSDEQMAALSSINVTGGVSYAGQGQELINLYNDLKKLTEE